MKEEQIESLWQKIEPLGLSRRKFLALIAAGGTAATIAALAPGVTPTHAQGGTPTAAPAPPRNINKPTPEQFFNLFGTNAEMRFEVMANRGYTMPTSFFFVRSHEATPLIDSKTWRLAIGGDGVEKQVEISYDDLLRMPSKTITRYVECAGNGRSFYDTLLKKPAQGTQWKLGAIGIAEWTGVPLSALLQLAGVKKTAVEVMPTGLDRPRIERPMSLAKAMEDDTILAYSMNGDILPLDHGFPARMIVPGWVGVNSVKWVGSITVSEKPLFVDKNTNSYVLIGPDYTPQAPAKGVIINSQVIKSAVALPSGGTLAPGSRTIAGFAWSPSAKIAKVEISLDGGKTWQLARLVGQNIERAGTRWEYAFDAQVGNITITPRATDELGNTQIELDKQIWNEQGYLFAPPVPHPITISATTSAAPAISAAAATPAASPSAAAALPVPSIARPASVLASAGKTVFEAQCQKCHGDQGQGVTAPALVGADIKIKNRVTNGLELFNYVRTTMPNDAPGSLSSEMYLQVTAYLLLQDKYVNADTVIDSANLAAIPIK